MKNNPLPPADQVPILSSDPIPQPMVHVNMVIPGINYTFNITLDTLKGDPKDGNTVLGALHQTMAALQELNNFIVTKLTRGDALTSLPEGITMHLTQAQQIVVPSDMGAALSRLGLVPRG